MKQFLEIGKINNTHGVKGELKLELWCDDIEYLKQFKKLYLDENGSKCLNVKSVKQQKNNAIISFEEINSIDEAESYKGKILYGDRNDASIDEDANYIQDIIGCYVIDATTEKEYGRVCDVVNYGASDILDIESWGEHFLVPMTPDIIVEIDTEYEVIRINAIKGLFDEN